MTLHQQLTEKFYPGYEVVVVLDDGDEPDTCLICTCVEDAAQEIDADFSNSGINAVIEVYARRIGDEELLGGRHDLSVQWDISLVSQE